MLQNKLKTYQAGVLQARSYRKLRQFMIAELKDHDLTMMEWSVLGLVYDYTSSGGASVGQIADLVDVEMSQITTMLNSLEKQGLLKRIINPADRRGRKIVTTKSGDKKVEKVEKQLRRSMRSWLDEIPDKQLDIYIRTLQLIAKK